MNTLKDENVEATVDELLKAVPTVILTLGEKGAAFATREDPVVKRVGVPAVDKVVDTTGAGDAFMGAFMYFVHQCGADLEQSIEKSCQIASLSVQREGTQSSYCLREELPESLMDYLTRT